MTFLITAYIKKPNNIINSLLPKREILFGSKKISLFNKISPGCRKIKLPAKMNVQTNKFRFVSHSLSLDDVRRFFWGESLSAFCTWKSFGCEKYRGLITAVSSCGAVLYLRFNVPYYRENVNCGTLHMHVMPLAHSTMTNRNTYM